jgi:hypothetical protein
VFIQTGSHRRPVGGGPLLVGGAEGHPVAAGLGHRELVVDRSRVGGAYLRDLPRPWPEASPEARQLIAASLFEEASALGWRIFSERWIAHAIRRALEDVNRGAASHGR